MLHCYSVQQQMYQQSSTCYDTISFRHRMSTLLSMMGAPWFKTSWNARNHCQVFLCVEWRAFVKSNMQDQALICLLPSTQDTHDLKPLSFDLDVNTWFHIPQCGSLISFPYLSLVLLSSGPVWHHWQAHTVWPGAGGEVCEICEGEDRDWAELCQTTEVGLGLLSLFSWAMRLKYFSVSVLLVSVCVVNVCLHLCMLKGCLWNVCGVLWPLWDRI